MYNYAQAQKTQLSRTELSVSIYTVAVGMSCMHAERLAGQSSGQLLGQFVRFSRYLLLAINAPANWEITLPIAADNNSTPQQTAVQFCNQEMKA